MIVALVAILVIVALGFILYNQLPATAPNNDAGIDVNLGMPSGSDGTTNQ